MNICEGIENAVIEGIASVCHAANKAFCSTLDDHSKSDWADAPEWVKQRDIERVKFRINNPDASLSAQHDSWLDQKKADGWVFGTVKDEMHKTHPFMVPYEDLPVEQKTKYKLFQAIVDAVLFYTSYNHENGVIITQVLDNPKIADPFNVGVNAIDVKDPYNLSKQKEE